MIQVTVNVTDGLSPMLREFISALDGAKAAELNEVGGRSAVNAAVKYHREFDKAGGWKGKRHLGPSGGDGSSFGADVARGWHFVESGKTGAVIANNATHYAFKVTGGTITPKRAKALTIPLIQEARGIYASVYQQNTGRRLFSIKGKNALFERIAGYITGSRGRKGTAGTTSIGTTSIRAVYALVKSVTMGPWPNAVPPSDLIASQFKVAWLTALEGVIEDS